MYIEVRRKDSRSVKEYGQISCFSLTLLTLFLSFHFLCTPYFASFSFCIFISLPILFSSLSVSVPFFFSLSFISFLDFLLSCLLSFLWLCLLIYTHLPSMCSDVPFPTPPFPFSPQSEEIFLDMFEDEWLELHRRPLNVEYLLQDASVLLPPAGTPLTGIDFNKRLPCGEVC